MRFGMLVLAACIAASGSAYASNNPGTVVLLEAPLVPTPLWVKPKAIDREEKFDRIEQQDINVRLVPMPLPRPANLDTFAPAKPNGHILEIKVPPLPKPRPPELR